MSKTVILGAGVDSLSGIAMPLRESTPAPNITVLLIRFILNVLKHKLTKKN